MGDVTSMWDVEFLNVICVAPSTEGKRRSTYAEAVRTPWAR